LQAANRLFDVVHVGTQEPKVWGKMKIGKAEFIWNFLSLVSKMGANIVLLPFVLSSFSTEYVGVWNFYSMITPIIVLFDFGFSSIFTQNLVYIFSGSQSILKNGYAKASYDSEVNYSLLNDLINSMMWLYKRFALLLFVFLAIFGTLYLRNIIDNIYVNKFDIYLSWAILIVSNSLFFYSFYYDSLLISSGKIKNLKQIGVLGQFLYVLLSILLLYFYKSFISIAVAQLVSIIVVRILSYRVFYTKELITKLKMNKGSDFKDVLKKISHNSRKLGLTALGGFLVQRSPFFIGGMYLSISDMASYGITMQVIFLTLSISTLYVSTKLPQISKFRVMNDKKNIYKVYIRNVASICIFYLSSLVFIYFFGNIVLKQIGSSTLFLNRNLIALGFFVSFVEAILSTSALVLQTKNEVPFYLPSIISGVTIIIGIYISISLLGIGLISLFMIPLIVDLSYQAWKWPYEVIKELKLNKDE
jgi:O-antigen/teichoic acid export membrane protein